MDQFFTPPALAELVVGLANRCRPSRIADFAAGDGELLAAAVKRWPRTLVFGIDKDPQMVRRLKKRFTNGQWLAADFLELSARRSPKLRIFERMDLVLLNPPFSIVSTVPECELDSVTGKVASQALAFILRSLSLLRRGGRIISIVPAGLLHSRRDRKGMNWIAQSYDLKVIEQSVDRAFKGVDVSVAIIQIIKRPPGKRARSRIRVGTSLAVKRGTFDHLLRAPIRSFGYVKCRFIHTTNLSNWSLCGDLAEVYVKTGHGSGAVVVLPRVGRPNVDKIVAIEECEGYVFSKCIIVIECLCYDQALRLRDSLTAHWDIVRRRYGGTGAQYITIDSIKCLVGEFGF